MKRFSKVLALCILLAVALSVFGVFSAFAEDAAEAPVVTYDMNSKIGKNGSIPSKAKDIKDANGNNIGKSVSLTYETLADGTPYYKHSVLGEDQGNGTYSTLESSSNAYIQISPTTTNIKDSSTYGAKNTDFMVIDFDLSTDDNLFNGFYFHTRWRTTSGATSQANYPHFGSNEVDETFYVASRDALTKKATVTTDVSSAWINVTMVYDFRGEDSANWNCHVYLDGCFAGSIAPCKADAANLYFMRISYDKSQPTQYSSANFANFTVKRFPVGYSGDLGANASNLANAAATLSEFDDLAYCLANTPNADTALPVATVTRGDETIEIKNSADLSLVLKDGDTVTLNRPVKLPVIVPAGANITWNTNGYAAPALTEVDYSAVDAVFTDLITGELVATSTAADLESAIKTRLSSNVKVTLLRDAELSVTAHLAVSGNVRINLNGNKLTITGSKHAFTPSSGAKLSIYNGDLKVALTGSQNLAMMNGASAIVLENIGTFESDVACAFDQRAGRVMLINCDTVTAKANLANVKSAGGSLSGFSLIDCDLSVLEGNAFAVGNTNKSGAGRYGSSNTKIVIENSTVNAPAGHLVSAEINANASGETAEKYAKNDNDFALIIKNSSVDVKNNLIYSNLVSVTNVNTGDPADGMTFDINATIADSDIKASYLLHQLGGDASVDYSYDAAFDVNTCNILLTGDTLVNKETDKATVSVVINGETMLTSNKLVADGIPGAELITVAPYAIINRTVTEENKYSYAVTTKCAPYPIIINGEETELQWYADDEITIEDLPGDLLPPPNNYVSYEWIYNDDGAFEAVRTGSIPVKANLTLKNDFTFNVYLPADLDAETYTTVTVNGKAVETTDVVVGPDTYKLVKVEGVNPATADGKVSLQFTAYIGGVRVDRITQRLSVIDYAKEALESPEVENKGLIASVVNYIAAVQAYKGGVSDSVAALLENAAYKNALPEITDTSASVNTVSALGVFDRVYLTLDSAFTYKFVTKSDFAGTVTVSYVKDGAEVVESYEVDGMEVIPLSVDSCDLLGKVTFTVNGASGEYSVAAYLDALSASEPEATALANAIVLYAQEASKAQ